MRRQYQRFVKNLEILEEQKAGYGFLDTPLHILNEIERHKEKIEGIKVELSSLEE